MTEERATSAVAYRAVLLAAGLLVFGLLFRQLATLLLAILITVIFAIALAIATDFLEGRKVPRGIGAFVALALGVGVVVGIFAVIIPAFVSQINEFAEKLPEFIEDLNARAGDLTGAEPDEVSDRVKEFTQKYVDDPAKLIGPLASLGLGLVGVLGVLFVILLTAYFIAVDPKPMLDGVRRLVPPAYRQRGDQIMVRLRTAWIGWMQGVAVDMLVTGVLLYIGLTIIGVDFAILFAVLAALFVVIPYFGAIAGGLPPVLFALTDSPGKALAVMLVYGIVQQVESNVTIPLVMARTVKLHPAVIAIGVVVVGRLFGFVGLIVAVPILSLIVILVEELWVKPMEEADRLDEEGPMGVPPSSEVGDTTGEREDGPERGELGPVDSPTTV
ncbi:MAG: AI-2E family transporter [Thermoleophilaceae bacterium]|nr:AI-2E family transporter [Thermoleophilaceae bacterium]